MSRYQMLSGLVALSGLCTVQAALADCGSSNERDARFQYSGLEVKFTPKPSGQLAAVGASIRRANEVAPYIRIRLGPDPAQLKNQPFDSEGGSVYYLKNSANGQRICRAEEWKKRESKLINAQPPAGLHPAVRHVYPYFELHKTYKLDYDGSGQLTSIQQIDAAGRRLTTFCVLYDKYRRVEVANESSGGNVSDDSDFTCSQLRENVSKKDTWYYTYRTDGFLASDLTKKATRKSGEGSAPRDGGLGTEALDGAWSAQGSIFFNGANFLHQVRASFQMSDKRGLAGIQSESFSIVPSDATTIFEQRSQGQGWQLNYTFPGERVPPEVAHGLFEGITDYTRVREYRHRSHARVFEIFSPSAKHPRERQWRTLDLNRQENYDDSGKLTRVILSGPVSDNDGYREDLRAYAEKGVLKLTPLTSGYSSYRVYDYDAKGNETLSFVCWRHETSTNKPYSHFPWWAPDTRPKRSREAELQYGRAKIGTRCGTPDGKMLLEGMGPAKKYMETHYGFGTSKIGFPGES